MSAKEKLKTFGKALDEAASDTAYYITPDIVSDAVYAMTPKKMGKYTRKSRDEFNARREEGRENVRKGFKMIGDGVKKAANKVGDVAKKVVGGGASAGAAAGKALNRAALKTKSKK